MQQFRNNNNRFLQVKPITFLRYAGSKRRILNQLLKYLPSVDSIKGRFIDPFVGGGNVFFGFQPKKALLSDINKDLIDLYRAIRRDPIAVWEIFANYPNTKEGYYEVRNSEKKLSLIHRAAKTLYLNRTCFRGWWRYNIYGKFNVGYGGESRRWCITCEDLVEISKRLYGIKLQHGDFELIIHNCKPQDFIFADPPYEPGEIVMTNNHYMYSQFSYNDYMRLQKTLQSASDRGVKWAMTTSSHEKIVNLFKGNQVFDLPKDPHKKLKSSVVGSGEVLICNYMDSF
ncbi:MAG: Dam family site-specific DNA-(adenine-N6)-methyltransferase [Pseudanabaena sp. M046S1SP1A06QC]|nr:Dam family site-specific DNA-(adenine-N6)-methyltransferase [Pseudanabaena sp. M046S1SP1A06QC]